MSTTELQYFDILAARQAYAEGRNVTETLRLQQGTACNTSEIIEVAYDLQAGSYIEQVAHNRERVEAYTAELAAVLDHHLGSADTLLDVGTGELTTLSLMTRQLVRPPKAILAFDISWSRVHQGVAYARQQMGPCFERLTPFVADIGTIPLRDKSVSITTSSHALEPNGGRLPALMAELFRITRDQLVLFEPCYEINSEAGRQRMDRLGYIKDVASVVEQLGGTLLDRIPIRHVSNPLNPTACYLIRPPAGAASRPEADAPGGVFSVPGTNLPLRRMDDFYFSDATGLCFPVLKAIPILKSRAAILASGLSRA
jgi:ubiquinone/menaquinone biosynthesis C-methylase UbiE